MAIIRLTFVALTTIWLASGATAGELSTPGSEAQPDTAAAEEQALTGRELLESCSAAGGAASEPGRFCMSFMVGLVNAVSTMQLSGEGPPLFCIDPNLVSPEAVRDTAVKWMQARPERAAEEAYLLVSEALHQAYPCAAAGSGPGASAARRTGYSG